MIYSSWHHIDPVTEWGHWGYSLYMICRKTAVQVCYSLGKRPSFPDRHVKVGWWSCSIDGIPHNPCKQHLECFSSVRRWAKEATERLISVDLEQKALSFPLGSPGVSLGLQMTGKTIHSRVIFAQVSEATSSVSPRCLGISLESFL